ncbi:MAG: diguanylate cyclase [Halieaceae bacterium]
MVNVTALKGLFRRGAAVVALALAFCAHADTPAQIGDIPLVSERTLQGKFSIAGQWQFQPGDDLAWATPEYDDSAWQGHPVPGRWPREGYPETSQFAWYRLTLQLQDFDRESRSNGQQLGVRIGKVMNAYELYAGGKLLGGVGQLPPLAEIDYDRQKVHVLPTSAIADDGTLVLAMRVWGGEKYALNNWGAGPYDGEFAIGSYSTMLLSGVGSQVPGLIFCMLFIGFGVYNIYLFYRNRQMNSYLWFGLLAVNIGLYGLMLNQWKYAFDISFLALKKFEFGLIYVLPALAIQAVWTLLDERIPRPLRAYQLTFVASSILVLVIPGHAIHVQSLGFIQLWMLPTLIYAPWLIIRKLREGNAEARTLFIGALIFVATCINDLMIDFAQADTSRLMPYGFVVVMVAMSISLANKFTSSLSRLEEEVAERTADLTAANERLAEAAKIDPLTGLYNRRGFAEEAATEIKRVFRNSRAFSVIIGDVDNFKAFNDQYGHACGDHVLHRVADLLKDRTRDVDRIARWGGEEFILLLPETEAAGAGALADKLRETIADNLFEFEGERLRITMTFGVAEHRAGESLEACIARADAALYHGKEHGRNKVMVGTFKGLTLVS